MPGNRIEALDRNLRLRAILGNALSASYTRVLNGVWTASFTLPYDDLKNEYCRPVEGYIRIIDEGEIVGPFRIISSITSKETTGTATYECLHVLSTLMDDIVPGFHQIGNIGIYTRTVLEYILSFQLTKNWRLGRCAFERQFEYGLEDETVLAAMFSIPKPISTPYRWTTDTTSYPWTVNLDVHDTAAPPQCYVRYGKNQLGFTKTVDMTNFTTRLYCYGFGEGVNRLGIEKVNNGVPYLQSPPEIIHKYGIWQRVFIDRRFEIAESLKDRGEALLAELQQPYIQYQIEAVDLYPETHNELDRFIEGKTARVIDDDIGEDVRTYVSEVHKRDILGNASLVDITLHNKPQDIAGSIAEIADVQRIEQLYSQGATNIYSVTAIDNADPTHPLVMKLWIPDTLVAINRIQLVYTLERFRAYETGTEQAAQRQVTSRSGGGQTTSAGGGQTTGGGGGTRKSTEAGGYVRKTEPSKTSGASSSSTSEATNVGSGTPGTGFASWQGTSFESSATTLTAENHRHSIPAHRHPYENTSHQHGMSHTHTIPAFEIVIDSHTHEITLTDHTHSTQTHSHSVSDHTHEVEIPGHAHGILYGIYEGPVASSVRIEIGGVTVPVDANVREVDIAAYMEKNSKGTILRGRYHTIYLYPNTLTRISATATPQVFVQSRGGSDY